MCSILISIPPRGPATCAFFKSWHQTDQAFLLFPPAVLTFFFFFGFWKKINVCYSIQISHSGGNIWRGLGFFKGCCHLHLGTVSLLFFFLKIHLILCYSRLLSPSVLLQFHGQCEVTLTFPSSICFSDFHYFSKYLNLIWSNLSLSSSILKCDHITHCW